LGLGKGSWDGSRARRDAVLIPSRPSISLVDRGRCAFRESRSAELDGAFRHRHCCVSRSNASAASNPALPGHVQICYRSKQIVGKRRGSRREQPFGRDDVPATHRAPKVAVKSTDVFRPTGDICSRIKGNQEASPIISRFRYLEDDNQSMVCLCPPSRSAALSSG